MKILKALIFAALLLCPTFAFAAGASFSSCAIVADYTSTNGFIWCSDGTDLSDYRSGVTGGFAGYLEDASGNRAYFDVGSAEPSGVTQTTVIKQDDCAADNTGDWTSFDGTLTFDTDHYELTRTAPSQGTYLDNVPATIGCAYVVSFDANQGTSAGNNIGVYINIDGPETLDVRASGAAYDGWLVYRTCETTTATGLVGLVSYITLNGQLIEFKNFKVLHIDTPGATGIYVVWDSVDSGFDYNDTSGYDVKIKRASSGGPRSRINRRVRTR